MNVEEIMRFYRVDRWVARSIWLRQAEIRAEIARATGREKGK